MNDGDLRRTSVSMKPGEILPVLKSHGFDPLLRDGAGFGELG